MTIGVLGVYVATIGRTHTLKVVLSRVCIFATQDRRPLVLWLGNGVRTLAIDTMPSMSITTPIAIPTSPPVDIICACVAQIMRDL